MKKNKSRKCAVPSKASEVTFSLLAGGFTLISAWNGFTFYRVLFGLSLAVLISATFETARLACLFRLKRTGKGLGLLSAVTYIIVAGVCAFASINSFAYEVIKRDRSSQGQYADQIYRVKQSYSRQIESKLAAIDRDMAYIEKRIAKYPKSGYWQRRMSGAVAKRDRLVIQRDKFLATEPENPGQWIAANSALFDLKVQTPSRDSEDMISVTQALKQLWGLGKSKAQIIMGIVVTVTVELSILLLALMAGMGDRSRSVTKKITGKNETLESVTSGIDGELLEKFLQASRAHFEKTGKMLPMRKLSPALRPVRKSFENLSREELEKYFED